MELKTTLIIAAVVGAIAYSVGRWAMPPKIETKIEVVEKEVIKRDVQIVEREVKQPDGTTIIDRTTVDRSTKLTDKESTKETIVTNLPKWHVSAGVIASLDSLKTPSYIITVEKNLFATISVGLTATTDKQVGVVLGYSF